MLYLLYKKGAIYMCAIGTRIKTARESNGWTQEELAQKMGYKSKSTINKIELGVNDVSQSKIKRFSDVLGVPIPYLMGWDAEYTAEASSLQSEMDAVVDSTEEHLNDVFLSSGYDLSAYDPLFSEFFVRMQEDKDFFICVQKLSSLNQKQLSSFAIFLEKFFEE